MYKRQVCCRSWTLRASLCLAVAVAACGSPPPPARKTPTRETRERAYRANNVGVALLEQLKYPEAATAFRGALGIDSSLAIGHLNLSLALMYEQELDAAAKEATEAARLMPTAPQPACATYAPSSCKRWKKGNPQIWQMEQISRKNLTSSSEC